MRSVCQYLKKAWIKIKKYLLRFLNARVKINKIRISREELLANLDSFHKIAAPVRGPRGRCYWEVKELAMQEIDAIAAAEKQARAICEQAKAQAAEQTVQAEKDGAARLAGLSEQAQQQLRAARQQADEQAEAFRTELDRQTAERCNALEQAAEQHADAAAAMIVERIWNSEWQS